MKPMQKLTVKTAKDTVAELKYGTILFSYSDLVDYLKKYLSYKKASYIIGKP